MTALIIRSNAIANSLQHRIHEWLSQYGKHFNQSMALK